MFKYLSLILLIIILFPLIIQAETVILDPPTKHKDFQQLINSIINIIFTLALAIAPIMFIIAGFYYLTAVGDPKKIQTAKDIILYTIIGLIIVISARGIMELFRSIFLRKSPEITLAFFALKSREIKLISFFKK